MTHLIFEDLNLLEGRIAFRKRWAMRWAYVKPKVNDKTFAWEIAYDEEHNFARMGAEFVDADWGIPKVSKPKAKRRSDFVKRSFVIDTMKAMHKEDA